MTVIHVYQSIQIQSLRVEGVTNSSVLQIGTAGLVKALSNNFNTGGFTGPAPEAGAPSVQEGTPTGVPLVPLPSLS